VKALLFERGEQHQTVKNSSSPTTALFGVLLGNEVKYYGDHGKQASLTKAETAVCQSGMFIPFIMKECNS